MQSQKAANLTEIAARNKGYSCSRFLLLKIVFPSCCPLPPPRGKGCFLLPFSLCKRNADAEATLSKETTMSSIISVLLTAAPSSPLLDFHGLFGVARVTKPLYHFFHVCSMTPTASFCFTSWILVLFSLLTLLPCLHISIVWSVVRMSD